MNDEVQSIAALDRTGPPISGIVPDHIGGLGAHALFEGRALNRKATDVGDAEDAGRASHEHVIARRAREVQARQGHATTASRQGEGSGRNGQNGLDTHLSLRTLLPPLWRIGGVHLNSCHSKKRIVRTYALLAVAESVSSV